MPRPVIVIDYGAQYAQLIARRIREENIYSKILPNTIEVERIISENPLAIILSGGPENITDINAPKIPKELLNIGVPILGICYGFQALAYALQGTVRNMSQGEYGNTRIKLKHSVLAKGTPFAQNVWMSHKVSVVQMPPEYNVFSSSEKAPVAGFENTEKKIFGIQWHPEVSHSEYGQNIIQNFLFKIAKIKKNWDSKKIITNEIESIKEKVGDKNVICGLSGGVDSSVAAALVHKAIGKQLTCVFVDHGLLRKGEVKQVEHDFHNSLGIKLITVNASKLFIKKLRNITDPEKKRKIIGHLFIDVFKKAAKNEAKKIEKPFDFLVQGTLYPDIVESGGGSGTSNIKSHHNVGGLPKKLGFELIEPLVRLFKDEVRKIGFNMGLPNNILERQPFPGPGLAIRIIGAINTEKLEILKQADEIVRNELKIFNNKIWQCPVILLSDVRSVGVSGDQRTYGWPIVLRPVTSKDAMTADWFEIPKGLLTKISTKITNEIPQITRVIVDVTQKPPGTIEWE